MDVSSSTQSPAQAPIETAKDPAEKNVELQKQQDQNVQENVDAQTKEVNAQKTGVGNNINITG